MERPQLVTIRRSPKKVMVVTINKVKQKVMPAAALIPLRRLNNHPANPATAPPIIKAMRLIAQPTGVKLLKSISSSFSERPSFSGKSGL